jgi:hypothetical protein
MDVFLSQLSDIDQASLMKLSKQLAELRTLENLEYTSGHKDPSLRSPRQFTVFSAIYSQESLSHGTSLLEMFEEAC